MSAVVRLEKRDRVGVVILEDRASKNTFSPQFNQGVEDTFEAIRQDSELKVVVIHGYDNYFCCGGTKEELFEILEGTLQFTDLTFFDVLLRCELPVIAAMQGHAIGGGLVFGSYADILVMGEECLYSANFMKFGFTPGMGGTSIIPRKFGEVLGSEMLFSARNYYGKELKDRGAPVNIVKKTEVIPAALRIAQELAEKPRLSLQILKRHLSRHIRTELSEVIEQELTMHKTTFAQSEVKNMIEQLYGC